MPKPIAVGDPRVLRRHELAAYLHVSIPTIDRWHYTGILPRPSKCGRVVLFDRASIDRWLAQRRRASS